jgi:hypothetical protein
MLIPYGFDTVGLHKIRIIPESVFAAGILQCRSFYAASFSQRSDIFADDWLLTELGVSISDEEEEEEEEDSFRRRRRN